MERETKHQILFWSSLVSGLFAFALAYWNLFIGEMPVVASIKILGTWTLPLPFAISRWWDIAIGPIWATISVFLLRTDEKENGKENSSFFMYLFPFVVGGLGIATGLFLVRSFGLIVGLIAGLVVALIYIFSTPPILRFNYGLEKGLSLWLFIGVNAALGATISVGIATGLILAIIFAIIFEIITGITSYREIQEQK